MLLLWSAIFFRNYCICFQPLFQKHYKSVKRFESRLGPTFCQSRSGSKPFSKVFCRRPKSTLAGTEFSKCVETSSCRMTDSAQDYVLNVTDVNVKLQDTSILHDVTFTATSGNILAIMGPTGKSNVVSQWIVIEPRHEISNNLTF